MLKIQNILRMHGTEAILPLVSLVCVNGLNYGFLITFTRTLVPSEFLGYTSALAVVMLAMALSEAGIVYAAPPFLKAHQGKRSARFAGGFILISTCILIIVTAAAILLWELARGGTLSLPWIARVLSLTLPNLILQNWLLIRLKQPIPLLVSLSFLRVSPLIFISQLGRFDVALLVSFLVSMFVFVSVAYRQRAFSWPSRKDIFICARLVRGFIVLRLFSTFVTSSAPFLLGILSTPLAVSAYVIGDRTKVLISSAFQPFVQGIYLVRCRNKGLVVSKSFKLIVMALVVGVVLSAVILSLCGGLINNVMYGGRYPDSNLLVYFVIAGHFAVLSSIGYFLYLIPYGHAKAFIRAAMAQGVVFITILLLFVRSQPIKGSACAVFVAELFLLLLVSAFIAYQYAKRPDRMQKIEVL